MIPPPAFVQNGIIHALRPEGLRTGPDQLAATTREDRRTVGKTCALPLATAVGRVSDAAALWEHVAADFGAAVASGGSRSLGGKQIRPERKQETGAVSEVSAANERQIRVPNRFPASEQL